MNVNQNTPVKSRGNVVPFARSGEYYFQRGIKSYQKKDLVKAKQLFEKAVQVEPEEPTYLCQLAATLAELGDFIESNDLLEYIVSEIDSDISECYYFMANNYAHLGMFREAESEAVRYMENDPNGEFYEDCEELLDLIHTEFGEDLEKCSSEEKLIVKHEKARRSLEKGDFSGARDLLKEMVLAHPEFWAAYNNLALAHFYLGEYDEAFLVLDDVLGKNSGNLHALCNAALFYKQLHQQKELERFTNCLKVIHPIIPEHRYKLGSTFALLEEDELAFQWLNSVRSHGYAWNVTFFHWLAVASLKTGRIQSAEKAWEKVLDLDEESTVATYYLEKLRDNTLDSEEAEYQYTMPLNKLQDPNDLSERIKKLKSTIHKNKLSHLLLIRNWNDEDTTSTLEAFCAEKNETLIMKELAATILFERGYESVQIQKESGIEHLHQPSDDMEKGLVILEQVLAMRGELDSNTAFLWHLLINEAREGSLSIVNSKAWAAAIAYMADYLQEKQTTQKSVAEQFGISASTIQKYSKTLKILHHRQTMKPN
ncbi:tetratricopeptide repeat protein [Pseudalkalibacillus salsuginis]|uniref:tetratricopeptide repeat protein n=1 Tax=Pseudalkalibacillus salsuginis TaxID=2910972 RepID=UPI001F39CEB7|nr:tetratricopeptide repeat protein [Pseudalkalibacillus salsuginis]MCF6410235.1 tetratricopeptide repeat protein [Pseudalkalibacillus salsuginis]